MASSSTVKVYYSASVRGLAFCKDILRRHFEILRDHNCEILTENIASKELVQQEEQMTDEQIFERDMMLINMCDVFIADVTTASLGVGFTVNEALSQKKPVLCVHMSKLEEDQFNDCPNISAMIKGCKNITLKCYYDNNSYEKCVTEFLRENIQSVRKHKIFLTGPPGSGKSTVGKFLEQQFGLTFVSTGQLLRDLVLNTSISNTNSNLIQTVKQCMDRGDLVPADIMMHIVVNKLLSPECVNNGFILDGYPPSYQDLQILTKYNIVPDLVLKFECEDNICIERQCTRNERSTDNEELAKQRMRTYHFNLPSSVDQLQLWYSSTPVIRIDATESKERVLQYISDLMNNYFNNIINISYQPVPLLSLKVSKPKSTKFHFHIDGENQTELKQILHKLFTHSSDLQQQVKMYPIEKLYLGPQTKSLTVYSNMMNFHEIVDGKTDDEAFVTGRLGNTFDTLTMLNVLNTCQSSKKRCMVEVEQYLFECSISENETDNKLTVTMDDMPINIDKELESLSDFNWYLAKDMPSLELHLAFDIPKSNPKSNSQTVLAIPLEDLTVECTDSGFNNGGWFIFADPKIWKYRSNEFSNKSLEKCKKKLLKQMFSLKNRLSSQYKIETVISGSIETVHGIWQL